jgi:chemotaxis protein methyltransferase CheR
VVPYLRERPAFKVWHPGCSSGEELISMAILLHEDDLLQNGILYGTDINPKALMHARRGVVAADVIRGSSGDYFAFGGKRSLAEYFYVNHGYGFFNLSRDRHIVFSEHSLVSDQSFGEMNLICCRNVLIYFGEEFRDRALRLITDSLRPGGFLCLGLHESLLFSAVEKKYRTVDAKHKIYRKN